MHKLFISLNKFFSSKVTIQFQIICAKFLSIVVFKFVLLVLFFDRWGIYILIMMRFYNVFDVYLCILL